MGDLVHPNPSYRVPPKDRRILGERILDAKIRGKKVHETAAELGLNERTAYRYMDLAISSRLVQTVDKYRSIENERLDATQRDIEQNIEAANAMIKLGMLQDSVGLIDRGMQARAQAIALQLRLAERRAKLNGLDAPVRVEATVHQADPREDELAEMMREAKARMANRG